MKRTTVSLPEDLLGRAVTFARSRRISLGALVREALRAYIDGPARGDDPISLGFGDSGGRMRGRDLGELPPEAYGLPPRR
jgi:hypothetical protein